MEQNVNEDTGAKTGPVYKGKTVFQWKQHWQAELDAEHKRNKHWRRQGDQITKRYLDKRKDEDPQWAFGTADTRLNLFYSNTYTQMSFMFDRVPKVDVTRAFTDAQDDAARVASNIFERMLNTSIETDGGDFQTTARFNLLDFLVPGLGVARVRYEMGSHQEETSMTVIDPITKEEVVQASEREVLDWEDAPIDYVHWRDFHWGHARIWTNVPWIGFDVYMTQEKATLRFGGDVATKLTYKSMSQPAEDENTDNPDQRDPEKTAKVTEIWCERTQSVFWYHEDCDYVLDVKEDPLELDGFYPSPPPMMANPTTDLCQPTPYFALAKDWYDEVDELSTRIGIITNAVKVNGVYDKNAGANLQSMLKGSIENDLIPVDNWAMFAEKGGLKGVIDWYPVDTVIVVLEKLRQMRAEAIDLLYQVTGLSDILRGVSQQYAGVGQEQLKASFSGVRIQYLQGEFARFVSDLMCLKAEVISKHFAPKSIVEQSNIGRSYDKTLVPQALQLIKSWNNAIWRIRVKPESMSMVDWGKLRIERTELLTALATFMQSAAPLLERVPQSAPMLLELLRYGLAGFKGSEEIETVIDAAIQQYQQNPQGLTGQGQGKGEDAKGRLKLVENQQKFEQDMMKQAKKARDEMEKMVKQFELELKKIRAETGAHVVKETVQADQNIREKQASQ